MNKKRVLSASDSDVPLSPELSLLPNIIAEPWFEIDPTPKGFIEGPAFDQAGNFFITSPPFGLVFKIDTQKRLTTIFENKDIIVDGAAFHRNGRLFVVCLSGELLVMNGDGGNVTTLHPTYRGKALSMNDIVFDPYGRMYVTDFIGSIMNPIGGVYRISEDATTVEPVAVGLVTPNGVSLSPENDILWIGETARNTILRITLMDDGLTPHPVDGVNIVYQSSGAYGPDSNKVDSDGNLYQCITGQGRVIILNKNGIPITNVLIPGRDEGKYLRTTNLAFKPGTAEGYITTSGEGGAWVFKFKALAKGLTLFSHR